MLMTRRHLRLSAWFIKSICNWRSALCGRLLHRPFDQFRFRNGIRFNIDVNSSDLLCVYESFGDRVYDRHFKDIAKDGTILDIGGNIGAFTGRAARDLVPTGRVIAIEPKFHCISQIETHLKLSRLANAQIVQAAVTAEPGNMALHVTPSSGCSTLLTTQAGSSSKIIQVPSITPKKVLQLAEAYEMVKVDCEEGEYALLYDTDLEDWKRIKRHSLEYHLGFDKSHNVTLPEPQDRLQALGFHTLETLPCSRQFGYIAAARA